MTPFALDYRRRAVLSLAAAAAAAALAMGWALTGIVGLVLTSSSELQEARRAIALAEGGQRERALAAELARHVMPAATPAESQAGLQTRVKDLAERHGADISSLQPMPPRRIGGLLVSRLQLQASIAEASLPRLFQDIADGSPDLLVAGLELTRDIVGSDSGQQTRQMAVRLDLMAFSRSGPAPAGAAP